MKIKKLKNWFRPAILKMKGYKPGEQPKDLSTVKLNTNENPYPPSAPILMALKSLGEDRLRRYPEPSADTLRHIISKVYHWPVDGILVGNGSDEILSMLFHAALGKADLVQYPDLTYSLYPVLARLREAKIKEVKLDAHFGLDFKKFSLQARLTLWGHPNPPAGNCFNPFQIRNFCEAARGLVLIDEAYVDFADWNCLSIAKDCQNVLVLRTMSKSFSLAGARLGFVLGHSSVIQQLMKVKDSYNVNAVTQAVGAAALSPESLKAMKKNIEKICLERNTLIETLRDMGFSVPDSQANFLLASRRGKPTAESLYKNLKKRRVLVRYFSHPRLRNSLRITVGTQEQNEKLLRELKRLI